MARLEIHYPVAPYYRNQAFGANPEYYAKFLDSFGNPEKGHMGIDLMAVHGQPVFAAHDGMARYVVDSHGGDGIYIRTTETFSTTDGESWFTTIYWHLCAANDAQYAPKIPTDGKEYPVSEGDLIGFADNTGAPFESSGDHLHLGLFPCNVNGVPVLPANGYAGCIDPQPFFTGKYAEDIGKEVSLTRQVILFLQKIVAYYQQPH